ncbi:MAG: hypothetical protein RTV41_00050 [Candidatus Thorarchaeota archaeon]
MAKKKKKKKAALSPSMFKVTGAHAKMKVDTKKKKLYYFGTKVDLEKAKRVAGKFGADILETTVDRLKVGKPKLKYEFFYVFDIKLSMKYLKLDKEDFVVPEHVKGALVGKEIFRPKKKDGFNKIAVDIIELAELETSAEVDAISSKGGSAGKIIEKVLRGPGKKKATSAWIRKNPIAPGKFNSFEKVIKNRVKYAKIRPEDAKRVISHSLVFNKLMGYYVPTYFTTVTLGNQTYSIKVNAVNGTPSVNV